MMAERKVLQLLPIVCPFVASPYGSSIPRLLLRRKMLDGFFGPFLRLEIQHALDQLVPYGFGGTDCMIDLVPSA